MDAPGWFLLIGCLLLLMAVTATRVARLPVSTAMIYLAIGLLLHRFGWLRPELLRDARWLELASEIAVVVSLFSAGLKLRMPLRSPLWRLPLGLATLGMAATVGLIAAAGVLLLGLPLGAAVVAGAILAPTDPVLASDVRVEGTGDTDRVRTALTGEAGLNDGTAFPFLLLGLGLLGHHPLGDWGLRWLALDVIWAVAGGLLAGGLLGLAAGRLVVHLRRSHHEALGLDDFLALGLIAASYGLAVELQAYGFIAVFAAGVALRTVERRLSGGEPPPEVRASAASSDAELAVHPRHAPAFMAEAVLRFNEQIDRIGELALVLLAGALLATVPMDAAALGFALLLFLLIRPLAVAPLCFAAGLQPAQAALVSWFGVRGIGSVYYLAYAVTHGLPQQWVQPLSSLTLVVIAASTVLHGLSGTPAMRRYAGIRGARRPR